MPREPIHVMLSEMRSVDLRTPAPAELTNYVPPRVFELDESKFNRNLRSSRRGATAGFSGMNMEHVRPLQNDARSLHSFFLSQKLLVCRCCECIAHARILAEPCWKASNK